MARESYIFFITVLPVTGPLFHIYLFTIIYRLSLSYNFLQMDFLEVLGLKSENKGVGTGANWLSSKGEMLHSYSPVDGKLIGSVLTADKQSYEKAIEAAKEAFIHWRMMPAPARGEIVRQIGEALREYKEPLGKLVSYEMGKSLQEGYGEVQE